MSKVAAAMALFTFGGGTIGYLKTSHPAPLIAGLGFGATFAAGAYLLNAPKTQNTGKWVVVAAALLLAVVQGKRSMAYDPPSKLGLTIASAGAATALYFLAFFAP